MMKFIELSTMIKGFAAMLFAGFICLYIVLGILYGAFFNASFSHTISFIHLVQAIGFSMLISLIWGVCFSGMMIKKCTFFKRYVLFDGLLLLLLGLCFFMHQIIATDWTTLWLIVASLIIVFASILSLVSEWYFKRTSIRYTEQLKRYQSNDLQSR